MLGDCIIIHDIPCEKQLLVAPCCAAKGAEENYSLSYTGTGVGGWGDRHLVTVPPSHGGDRPDIKGGGDCKGGGGGYIILSDTTPPPPCISYALVQATVGVGTVIIVYVILITYEI